MSASPQVVFVFTCAHAGKADAREEKDGKIVCNDCRAEVRKVAIDATKGGR